MKKPYVIKSRGLFKCDADKPFKISRSQIEAFVECPRCFWLNHRRGLRRPSGPPFTINMLVDKMLKKEFDAHRAAGTSHPITVANGLDVRPFQHADIDEWRNNFKGMSWIDPLNNLKVTGAVDDIWQHRCDDRLIVVDYKATAKDGVVTLDDEWKITYKRQMDVYIWLLRKLGFEVDDRGFFLYANGQIVEAFDNAIKFDVTLLPYVSNTGWIEPTLLNLKACLLTDDAPSAPDDCEFCGYIAAQMPVHAGAEEGVANDTVNGYPAHDEGARDYGASGRARSGLLCGNVASVLGPETRG